MNELIRRLLFLPPQASTFARGIDGLHFFVISVTLLSATLIALTAMYFTWRYRETRPRETVDTRADPRTTRTIEAVLTVMTLGLFLALWVVGFRQFVRMSDAPADSLVVYVTGKQWMWKFAHEEGPSEVGVLTIPSHRPVKVVMTSRDVIHSFYVPAFRIKQDVIPGRYVSAWFEAEEEGSFDLFCAEYCGTEHSGMITKVNVLSPTDYAAWLAGARAVDPRSLVERGRVVAAKQQCLGCHTVDGKEHIGPTWRGLYASEVHLTDGRVVVADEGYLTRSMMMPNEDIVTGYRSQMPSYFGRLDAGETAALVAYIRALAAPEMTDAVDAPPRATGSLAVDAGAEP